METTKLKPFDLEKAKQGAKVITRDGRPVRIICWDRVDKTYQIVVLVMNKDGVEDIVETYSLDGACMVEQEYTLDLFMAPTTVEKWVNVYKSRTGGYYNGSHHDSEQEALVNKADNEYVTTIKIAWEE